MTSPKFKFYPWNYLHFNLQCSRGHGLDALHEGLFDDIRPDVAVLGAGCSVATEAVTQQAKYYTLPVVRREGGGWGGGGGR